MICCLKIKTINSLATQDSFTKSVCAQTIYSSTSGKALQETVTLFSLRFFHSELLNSLNTILRVFLECCTILGFYKLNNEV